MKMKQTVKRLLACTLALSMLLVMPMVTTAKAEVKDDLPTKFRVYTSSTPWSRTLSLSLADKDKSIDNVKSSSKDLQVALVGINKHYNSEQLYNNTYRIGMIPFKNGTYTVSYDIIKNKKVVDKKKITVYAYPSPKGTLKVDGKYDDYYGTKTKAKIEVTMEDGNVIKKLEVGTYKLKTDKNSGDKSSEMVYKTFKNGATVNLGKTGYYYEYKSGERFKDEYASGSMDSSLNSDTMIRVTYIDKYTKQEETRTYGLYGLAK